MALGLSVKHCKEKCADLISKVESVYGIINVVEMNRECNGLSSTFMEDCYKITVERFLESIKDCKACIERYA